jgi:hypothetical protein
MFFGTHILRRLCRTEPTEEKGSWDKAIKIAAFTSSRPSSLGDDENSPEFRPKIASVQNLVILEYEMAFSWSTTPSSKWITFF